MVMIIISEIVIQIELEEIMHKYVMEIIMMLLAMIIN